MQKKFAAIFFLPQYSPQLCSSGKLFLSYEEQFISKIQKKLSKSYSDVTLREVEKIIKGIGRDQIINLWSHSCKTLNDENQKFIGMIKGEIKGYPFLS